MSSLATLLSPLLVLLAPLFAHAHEMYVLDAVSIARALSTPSLNPFTAYSGNEVDFFFWGAVAAATTLAVLFASLYRACEVRLDPLLYSLKRYAHPVARVACGICLIASGTYGSLFGPELPLAHDALSLLFICAGICITAGLYSRFAALLMIAVWGAALFFEGLYLLTYANFLGLFILIVLLGSGEWSLDRALKLDRARLTRPFERYAFPFLRILFGVSVIFASVYAKFIHSNLALEVVSQFGLTAYFPFDPLFVVLGALVIEFLAGLFLIIGFEIRWTCLFLIFWLSLSLLYFDEAAWPHFILFGAGLAIFLHGYDRFSLEGFFLKRRKLEPVL